MAMTNRIIFFAVYVDQGKSDFYCFKGFEMLTYMRKNGINRAIITWMARIVDNLVNPPRLQKKLGKEY